MGWAWTSPIVGAPSRRCRRPTAARTSSSPRSPTSCATRSRRSARSTFCASPRAGRGGVHSARAIMERQVAQMVRLVDDLLDVARITTGKIELRREPIDLAEAVRDAVETARPALDAAGQHTGGVAAAEPLVVDADRTRLAQVFGNLLNNSAKYTEPRPADRASRLTREGGEAVVRVSDTGIGIPPEQLPHVFDLFARPTDRERSRGGLGIGLVAGASASSRCTAAASRPTARGPGRAASSWCGFRASRGASGRAGADPAKAPGAAPRRILVVDDNADAADRSAMLLLIGGTSAHRPRRPRGAVEAAAIPARTWCSSTSACRGWTAMKRRADPRSSRGEDICWSRSPAGDRRKTVAAQGGGLQSSPGEARRSDEIEELIASLETAGARPASEG